jgi:hypothetical protein
MNPTVSDAIWIQMTYQNKLESETRIGPISEKMLTAASPEIAG